MKSFKNKKLSKTKSKKAGTQRKDQALKIPKLPWKKKLHNNSENLYNNHPNANNHYNVSNNSNNNSNFMKNQIDILNSTIDSIIAISNGGNLRNIPITRNFLLGTSNNNISLSKLKTQVNLKNIILTGLDDISFYIKKLHNLPINSMIKYCYAEKEETEVKNIINLIRKLPINIFIDLLYAEILKLNKHTSSELLKNKLEYTENSLSINNWDLSSIQLVKLPEIFSCIEIKNDLLLNKNGIESLPKSFGLIKIGKNLDLSNCVIKKLPESFGFIEIRGSLNLQNNNLKYLPDSFSNMKIGEHLILTKNELEYLPDNFGKIEKLGGDLRLNRNELKKLPNSISDLKIGKNLTMSYNLIEHLPQNFYKIDIGGELNMKHNKIEKENINIGKFINVKGDIHF